MSSPVHGALITCCRCRVDYDFFPCGQSTFMQWCSVALHKRLISAPVHTGGICVALELSLH